MPCGMAFITGIAVINVPGNPAMFIGQVLGVIVCVAVNATEYGIIARGGMAVRAIIPFSIVPAAVNGEIHAIVVKVRRFPGIFRVAACTVGREPCRRVIGVVGLAVVTGMAAVAGIGGVGIIPIVAGVAVIGDGYVGAPDGIDGIVVK